ncbi:MAG: long-chain fatty acid--CoA ligase [Caulobacteraceae bacterium]|nr:long-chain fatty acid--CoA ligase [Caulobacteraceae bacterium]
MSDRPFAGAALRALVEAGLERSAGEATPALDDGEGAIPFDRLIRRAWIDAAPEALEGRSLLLLTRRPLSAAVALCALDGVARRLAICPPDLQRENLARVIADAEADAVVFDGEAPDALPAGVAAFSICATPEGLEHPLPALRQSTEWALFTSGTTGAPKMVVHTLAGLTGAIAPGASAPAEQIVWGTFYDIRRYGGLQMLLRALIGGHAMQLTGPHEPMSAFLPRLAAAGVTHLSGTPSHWRSALMHSGFEALSPRYVRLSGEIADQPILDRLAARFPAAAVGHAYASTEAGVGFEVNDGLEGFPAAFLDRPGPVEMRVVDGTLRIRSPRAASGYLGEAAPVLADDDGFVDTGDLVERRGERLYFMGRASGVINVGGLKVHPAEVEAAVNRCEGVRMSLVAGRKSPIMGSIVAAKIVLVDPEQGLGERGLAMREAILARCRAALAPHKVPASITFVEDLPMTAGGKVERRHA